MVAVLEFRPDEVRIKGWVWLRFREFLNPAPPSLWPFEAKSLKKFCQGLQPQDPLEESGRSEKG